MVLPRSATLKEIISNRADVNKEEQKDKQEVGKNHRKMKSGLVMLRNRSRKLSNNHE